MRAKRAIDPGQWVIKLVVTHRWWVMIVVSILAILNEAHDHIFASYPAFEAFDFFRGAIIYGLILPFLGGIVIQRLEKSEVERVSVVQTMNQEELVSHELANASTWKSLIASITEFPSRFLPVAVTSVYVVNRSFEIFEFAGSYPRESSSIEGFPKEFPISICANCRLRLETPNHVKPCTCQLSGINPVSPGCFCLPLVHGDQLIGMMFIAFPASLTVPLGQFKVFTRMAPEISLALDRAILQRSMLNQAATNEAERRRIAQDMHDSLAQNIGFLRLKLDQLTGEDAVTEISEIRDNLNHMKQIADISYNQVRDTLTSLRPKEAVDLGAFLQNYAKSIGDRTGMTIQFESNGIPIPVPQAIYRQISFICQEAMINGEKHSDATTMDVIVKWSENALNVRICDNGIGFDPSSSAPHGHYGISIMRERAEEIHAHLRVLSHPGGGTTVELTAPIQFEGHQSEPQLVQDHQHILIS
jgi:signal transduction histidine kinase